MIGNLTSNTKYDVRVIAKGEGFNYSNSDPAALTVTTSDLQPLSTPTSPRETAKTETSITVAWNGVANASEYRIAWRNTADSANTYVRLVAGATSYTLTGLDSSASYYWKVQALGDNVNYVDSAYTTAREVTLPEKLPTPNVDPWATSTSVNLLWNSVVNANGYAVSYKLWGGSSWSSEINVGTNHYMIQGLTPDTSYCVRVRALGDGNDYVNSDYATLTVTTKSSLPSFSAPTNFHNTAKTPTSITVAWDAVTDVTIRRYEISYKLANASSSSWSSGIDVGANLSRTITGLAPGSTYNVRIKAIGDYIEYGDSKYATITVTTPNLGSNSSMETPSTFVSTNLDVVDPYDGLISLREAFDYATSGGTITFASSLKGKTIALDPTLGQLSTSKSLTINATNLRNTTTSEPGLTISGQNATRILELEEGADVNIYWIKFANGSVKNGRYASETGGGAIYNDCATLSLNNCVISDNESDWGGGIYAYTGWNDEWICENISKTTLTNCVLTNNNATGSDNESGGAVFADHSTLLLQNCTITGNESRLC